MHVENGNSACMMEWSNDRLWLDEGWSSANQNRVSRVSQRKKQISNSQVQMKAPLIRIIAKKLLISRIVDIQHPRLAEI